MSTDISLLLYSGSSFGRAEITGTSLDSLSRSELNTYSRGVITSDVTFIEYKHKDTGEFLGGINVAYYDDGSTGLVFNSDVSFPGRTISSQKEGTITGSSYTIDLSKSNNLVLNTAGVSTTLTPSGHKIGQSGNIVVINTLGTDVTISFTSAWYVAGSDVSVVQVAGSDRAIISYYATSDSNSGNGEIYASYIASFGPLPS